jgi:hypothetical protein
MQKLHLVSQCEAVTGLVCTLAAGLVRLKVDDEAIARCSSGAKASRRAGFNVALSPIRHVVKSKVTDICRADKLGRPYKAPRHRSGRRVNRPAASIVAAAEDGLMDSPRARSPVIDIHASSIHS